MNKIVQKNLELMIGREEGQMMDLLTKESFGGNAGCHKTEKKAYTCGAANFYYNSINGQIVYFGNCQDVPEVILRNYSEGIMRVAFDAFASCKMRVINMFLKGECDKEAMRNLEDSIDKYNTLYGFEF